MAGARPDPRSEADMSQCPVCGFHGWGQGGQHRCGRCGYQHCATCEGRHIDFTAIEDERGEASGICGITDGLNH